MIALKGVATGTVTERSRRTCGKRETGASAGNGACSGRHYVQFEQHAGAGQSELGGQFGDAVRRANQPPARPAGRARCGRDAGRRASTAANSKLTPAPASSSRAVDIGLEVEEIRLRRGHCPIAREPRDPATRRRCAALPRTASPARRNTRRSSNRRTRSCWRLRFSSAAFSRPGHSDTRIAPRSAAMGLRQRECAARAGKQLALHSPDRRRRS